MSAQAALDAVADSLSLTPTLPNAPGQPAVVALNPPPGGLSLTEILPGTLKATWLSKDVLFKTSGFESQMGNVPPDLTALTNLVQGVKPYLSNVGSFITPPSGTPGLLGQLVAELPSVTQAQLPVAASVTWKAQDASGNDLPAAAFSKLSETNAGASILFAPSIVEATGGLPPAQVRRIRAEVTLSVTLPNGTKITNTGAPKALSVDVPVPSLAVPTIVALFNHAPFDLTEHGGIPGCVLVWVPPGSPYRDIGSLIAALEPLASGLSALAPTFAALSFLSNTQRAAQAIGRLVDLLRGVTDPSKNVKLVVRASGNEPYLDKIVFYQQFLYFHTAEDTFGSLLMVGMPGKAAKFYNARNFSTSEGAFTVRLPNDALAAVIESLHSDPPGCDPPSAVPTSGADYIAAPAHSFGDRFSSLEFK
ncbi:MAG TPA: hypothetical protein VF712_08880 [Thermoleophilaceae bacterium]|jgi:hypothetical protein